MAKQQKRRTVSLSHKGYARLLRLVRADQCSASGLLEAWIEGEFCRRGLELTAEDMRAALVRRHREQRPDDAVIDTLYIEAFGPRFTGGTAEHFRSERPTNANPGAPSSPAKTNSSLLGAPGEVD